MWLEKPSSLRVPHNRSSVTEEMRGRVPRRVVLAISCNQRAAARATLAQPASGS